MYIKIIGALMIIIACGGIGFKITVAHRKTEKMMGTLLSGIQFIQQELQYRMSPLPEILLQTGKHCSGIVGQFFNLFSEELERQISPDTTYCVEAALRRLGDVPSPVRQGMVLLGKSLGHFDVIGQLKMLESVYAQCNEMLIALATNQDVRLRNYRTIALCTGVTVAIIFI